MAPDYSLDPTLIVGIAMKLCARRQTLIIDRSMNASDVVTCQGQCSCSAGHAAPSPDRNWKRQKPLPQQDANVAGSRATHSKQRLWRGYRIGETGDFPPSHTPCESVQTANRKRKPIRWLAKRNLLRLLRAAPTKILGRRAPSLLASGWESGNRGDRTRDSKLPLINAACLGD